MSLKVGFEVPFAVGNAHAWLIKAWHTGHTLYSISDAWKIIRVCPVVVFQAHLQFGSTYPGIFILPGHLHAWSYATETIWTFVSVRLAGRICTTSLILTIDLVHIGRTRLAWKGRVHVQSIITYTQFRINDPAYRICSRIEGTHIARLAVQVIIFVTHNTLLVNHSEQFRARTFETTQGWRCVYGTQQICSCIDPKMVQWTPKDPMHIRHIPPTPP